MQSDGGSDVAFWVVDPLAGHPLLASLPGTVSGFRTVARNADHALDYVKAPLFTWTDGRSLPPSGSASSDDLQDLLSLYLDQCKAAGGEIYAFGAKFDQNLHKPIDAEFGNTDGLHGIHDIHMNQGNVGQHAGDNGVFHDGGLILKFPDRYLGLFLGFQTQRIPTDAAGNAATGATPISQLLAARATTATAVRRHVSNLYRARADQSERSGRGPRGRGSRQPLDDPQTLTNWRLVDKNASVTSINTTIGPGQSTLIALDGTGVQLGNKGGNLMLQDSHNAQVDVIIYTAQDASIESRYVRFRH